MAVATSNRTQTILMSAVWRAFHGMEWICFERERDWEASRARKARWEKRGTAHGFVAWPWRRCSCSRGCWSRDVAVTPVKRFPTIGTRIWRRLRRWSVEQYHWCRRLTTVSCWLTNSGLNMNDIHEHTSLNSRVTDVNNQLMSSSSSSSSGDGSYLPYHQKSWGTSMHSNPPGVLQLHLSFLSIELLNSWKIMTMLDVWWLILVKLLTRWTMLYLYLNSLK